MKTRLLFTLLVLVGLTASAQYQFQTTGDIGSDDYVNKVISTGGDGYFMVGSSNSNTGGTYDAAVMTANEEGNFQTDGGQVGGTGTEFGTSLEMTSTGAINVVGRSSSFSTGGDQDMLLVRLDQTGNPSVVGAYGSDSLDYATDVVEANDGHIIIVGRTDRRNDVRTDGFITKIDSATGDVVWAKELGHEFINDWVYDVKALGAGEGYLVAGFNGANIMGVNEAWVMLLDDNGDKQLTFLFGGSGDDDAREIILGDAEEFYIAGNARSIGAGGGDAFLARFDINVGTGLPELTWFKTYGTTSDESLQYATKTGDGHILLVGSQFGSDVDGFVVKTDEDGVVQWTNTFGSGSGDDFLMDVVVNNAGGYTAVGYSNSFGGNANDAWMVSMDTDGNSLCNYADGQFTEETQTGTSMDISNAILAEITSTTVTHVSRTVVPTIGNNDNMTGMTLCTTVAVEEGEAVVSGEVYPIPASDVLNIRFAETGTYDINIYAVDGRLMLNDTYSGSVARISVESLNAGVYVMEAISEAGKWTSRVVKN